MSSKADRRTGAQAHRSGSKLSGRASERPSARLNADKLVRALQGAYAKGLRRRDLLQLVATRMREAGSPYTGVYVYMVHGDTLELEAFEGHPTEHTRIPIGKGLCGRALAEARDINAPDVAAEPEYLACSVET
ncbi:MAG: hypothetical protein HY560_02165, partial [Gemmatimonadetes bacterium]|nr:hypothetical protein [Gemmatimonadota bacterium]